MVLRTHEAHLLEKVVEMKERLRRITDVIIRDDDAGTDEVRDRRKNRIDLPVVPG